MPHRKCVVCRIRMRVPADRPDEPCPGCGRPLAPVRDLTEIVGFRVGDQHRRDAAVAGHQRIADAVSEIMARQDHLLGRDGGA
jgi:hypothetical protein